MCSNAGWLSSRPASRPPDVPPNSLPHGRTYAHPVQRLEHSAPKAPAREPCQDLKDGLIVSGKYESEVKSLNTNPHIFVFANIPPQEKKMSSDRWNIITDLRDSMKLHDFFPPEKYPEITLFPDPFGREESDRFAERRGLEAAPTYVYAGPMWRPPLMLDYDGVVHPHPLAGTSPTPPETPPGSPRCSPWGPTPGNTPPPSPPHTPALPSSSSKREKPSPHSTSPLTCPALRKARAHINPLDDVDNVFMDCYEPEDEFMGMPEFPMFDDAPSDVTRTSAARNFLFVCNDLSAVLGVMMKCSPNETRSSLQSWSTPQGKDIKNIR